MSLSAYLLYFMTDTRVDVITFLVNPGLRIVPEIIGIEMSTPQISRS
jgi:hypothetical protein